ncbi:hypothetical protein [Thalassobacillus pellis]|uniref:hypothetical protein n=1 Tax=Thalassobacillus pellis TaxID=748008 RepID=UPI001961C7D4|nr:hypothetical protein [Thalassobacillus pellis]MBM7553121.1 hypothetical protein [Thalassobacillus pellis]
MAKKNQKYTDFSNVETQRNFLTAEEFPEGPFGAEKGKEVPVENKDTPWKDGQQYYSNSTFENRNLHEGMPRQFPQAHVPHDDKTEGSEDPYNDAPNKNNGQMS